MPTRICAATLLFTISLVAVLPGAHALSPHAQFESGVPLSEILCPDGKVLLESPRGTPACTKAESADRLTERGFKLVQQSPTEPNPNTQADEPQVATNKAQDPTVNELQDMASDLQENKEPQISTGEQAKPVTDEPNNAAEPQITTLVVSSPVEFVDDEREYDKVFQRRPAPIQMYDLIMDSMKVEGGGMIVGQSGEMTFSATEHEKYSINPGVGFYVEDWLPTYIPDGYKLLYGGTTYETWTPNNIEYEEYTAYYRFTPSSFVLHPNVTDYDIQFKSKMFWIKVVKTTAPIDEIEDVIERRQEVLNKPPEWYGGVREMTRDGDLVFAFEGGNSVNPHRSVIGWQFAEDSYLNVLSHHLTLDEIIPIFESIRN